MEVVYCIKRSSQLKQKADRDVWMHWDFRIMRDRIAAALKTAMQTRNKCETNTLRLITAAIIDRDIVNRRDGGAETTDTEILGLLVKMVKQREEAARIYEGAGRLELAEQEREEIAIIERFLPEQMDVNKTQEACVNAIMGCNAASLRDVGRVMGVLKGKYTGQMDFGKASSIVKKMLS